MTKKFRPKKLSILGSDWKIKYQTDVIDKYGAYGMCYFEQHLILIQRPTRKYPLTEAFIEATIFHELSHVLLYTMNEEQLNQDEKFVELMGLCLHHMIKTLK
jgi:predicted SprT family Zn-dependent metalloprotease